jgi:hypothetical protein
LVHYVNENVILPCRDHVIKNNISRELIKMSVTHSDKQGNTPNDKILKEFAAFKDMILDLKDSRSEPEGVKVSAEA